MRLAYLPLLLSWIATWLALAVATDASRGQVLVVLGSAVVAALAGDAVVGAVRERRLRYLRSLMRRLIHSQDGRG